MKQHDETSAENKGSAKLIENLSGILLPFTTPFDASGGVDARALYQNISLWNETGVSGYVALGSTGERVHLTERECLKAIEAARESVSGQMSLIVGVGQQSTQESIYEARQAAEMGAEALLVITPHFYRSEMTHAALVHHYLAVADASTVPVLLYSVPQFTNISLAPETIARLSEHENIIGVKDSSGDLLALAETVRLVPENFAVLTGNGSALYQALCAGARGAILAVGCIAPRLAVVVFEAFQAGEHESARQAQRRLTGLTRGVLGRYGVSGLKAALDMLGYAGGRVRAPLHDASEEARREIAAALKDALLLEDETGDGE